MLFILDDSIIEYITEGNADHEDLLALEKIVTAYLDKTHLLSASPRLLRCLSTRDEFSKNQKMAFTKLLNFALLQDSYLDDVKGCVRVFPGNEFEHCVLNGKMDEYCINLKELNRSKYLTAPMLICESQKDCIFFITAFNILRRYFGITDKYFIEFEYSNGGGNDTHLALSNSTAIKRIALVLADSDKQSDKDRIGKTASQIIQKLNDENIKCGINKIIILAVREKENLIPPIIYMAKPKSGKSSILKDLDLIIKGNSTSENPYYYIDLKDGVKYSKIVSCEHTAGLISSLYEICDGRNYSALPSSFDQIIDRAKNAEKDSKLFDGIGGLTDDVLEYAFGNRLDKEIQKKEEALLENYACCEIQNEIDTLKVMKRRYDEHQSIFPEHLSIEWRRILESMIMFGCCPSKIS